MTNPKIDNAIDNERVILWQYDNASNLIALVRKWNDFGKISVTDFWDYYRDSVMNIDGADDFGLTVWGNALNTPWPSIKIPSSPSATVRKIGRELFRRLLKAKMYLMWKSSTVENFNTYLSILFPNVAQPLTKVDGVVQMYKPRNRVLDFQNMSMAYTFPSSATQDEAYLIFQHYDKVYPFPAGIKYPGGFTNTDRVLGFNGQGLKNFAWQGNRTTSTGVSVVDNVMVWADESVTDANGNVIADGGIFSGTEKANYKINSTVKGKAFVYDVTTAATVRPAVSGLISSTRYWIDFGDGEATYVDTQSSSDPSATFTYQKNQAYAEIGLYAISVYTESSTTSMDVPGATAVYSLS